MQERLRDSWLGQPLQVVARFGEPHAFEMYGPNTKHLAHEVVEREPFRNEIAPWFFGTELDTMFPLEPLEHFKGDKGDLLPRAAHVGKGSVPEKIPVALEAFPWNGAYLGEGHHAPFGGRRNVDGD